MTNPLRLSILGDSFAIPFGDDDPAQTWQRIAAQKIGDHYGRPCMLINRAVMGCAQDYTWTQLHLWAQEATEDDLLVIAVTHPARFWFLERLPQLSNVNIIDLDKYCSKDEERAIESYIRYIQRPQLDTMMTVHRMAWLAYQIKNRGLRRPVMLQCFDMDLGEAKDFPELNWSEGNLMDGIQRKEFADDVEDRDGSFWYGIDGRYNHMCLSNHAILGPRVAEALINDTPVNVNDGFVTGLLTEQCLDDDEFVRKELCTSVVEEMRELKRSKSSGPILPWRKKKSLNKFVQEV